MLIKHVELANYGAYSGNNSFDLTTTPGHPVVLIGGTNGAGKTTLFESVLLCLYGSESLDGRVTQKSYEAHLAKKVHRTEGMSNRDGASISVTFQISHAGKIQEYKVTRSWDMNGGAELLHIQSIDDGKISNTNMDAKGWQSFIDGLIPRGIARLFFFDGERIVRMMEEGESAVIKSSFDTLLGLDIIHQLRRDLEVNMMRNIKGNNAHIQAEFKRLTTEKKDTEERIARLTDRLASKKDALEAARCTVREIEDSISSLGGGFAARRSELKAKREAASKVRDAVAFRIREACANSLPFAVIPTETKDIVSQIHEDRQAAARSITAAAVSEAIERAKERLSTDNMWNELENGSELRSILIPKLIAALEPVDNGTDNTSMFSLSREQEDHMLSTINNSSEAARALKKDSEELMSLDEEISQIDVSLASAPNDDEIGPIITRLGKAQSELGMLDAEINHIKEEKSSLEALSRHIQIKIRGVVSQLYKDKKAGVRVELTKNVQQVLDSYAKKLTDKKLSILEANLLDSTATLLHKKGLIDHVKVDRSTYAITLYRQDGIIIPKDSLSKGEQQMLTTAVLWALARTSGRPLPFMIDTPLARLDTEHRSKLIEKFFPAASHQVIIFSTDSEIGSNELEQLGDCVSRSYAIEYSSEKDRTLPRLGYFEGGLQIAV